MPQNHATTQQHLHKHRHLARHDFKPLPQQFIYPHHISRPHLHKFPSTKVLSQYKSPLISSKQNSQLIVLSAPSNVNASSYHSHTSRIQILYPRLHPSQPTQLPLLPLKTPILSLTKRLPHRIAIRRRQHLPIPPFIQKRTSTHSHPSLSHSVLSSFRKFAQSTTSVS